MRLLIKRVLSIPRTIWFNFRYFEFKQAVKLPVWIAPNVRIKNMWRGGIVLGVVQTGIVRIGYHEADGVDVYSHKTILDISRGGYLMVKSDIHIGHGAVICINKGGTMNVGHNFAVSGTTAFICNDGIEICDDVQFSWNSVVMDSSAHTIFDLSGNEVAKSGKIKIGSHVWIGAGVTILKDVSIADNCVIAGSSMVNKSVHDPYSLIAGIPAKVVRQIGGWKI